MPSTRDDLHYRHRSRGLERIQGTVALVADPLPVPLQTDLHFAAVRADHHPSSKVLEDLPVLAAVRIQGTAAVVDTLVQGEEVGEPGTAS